MDRVICDICGKSFKNYNSFTTHKSDYHRGQKSTIRPLNVNIRPIEDKKPLDLHIYPTQEEQTFSEPDYLDQYLRERNNHYDAEDFEKYKKKMIRTVDERKKASSNKPYEKPDDEVAGPSGVKSSRCHICKIKLPSREAREAHLDAKHPSCEECGDRFYDHKEANKHYEIYHGPSKHPIICLICQKSFWKSS